MKTDRLVPVLGLAAMILLHLVPMFAVQKFEDAITMEFVSLLVDMFVIAVVVVTKE